LNSLLLAEADNSILIKLGSKWQASLDVDIPYQHSTLPLLSQHLIKKTAASAAVKNGEESTKKTVDQA
jgi:hypothetical protein